MSIISKKVNRTINENILTFEDICTRSEYWEKPINEITLPNGVKQKEDNLDYRDLVIYTKWQAWQEDYKFLPTPDKFVKIKEKFLNETWGTLEKLPYYITRNKNNTLNIILQNRGQFDFADPRIVLFFGRNTANPECKAKQEKAGRKGVEYPNLYWITGWDYVNNKSLLVQITAEKDPIWSNYGDMMNSKGTALISKSQFNNDHLNKSGQIIKSHNEHWPNDQDWSQQAEHICSACENCYDFCGDLRIKRAVPVGYSVPKYPKWQPEFRLLYSYTPPFNARGTPTTFNITDDQGKIICCVPSNIRLRAWSESKGEEILKNLLTDASKPSLLFLVDGKHQTTGITEEARPFSNPVRYPANKDEYIWEELPKCYHDQPHLCNHSSAQFYFQKKLLFTANLKHLYVRRKSPGWALGFRILVRSSISGILYSFESGDIFYKWELKVRGSVINENLITQLTSSVLMGFVKKGGKLLADGISSLVPAGTFAKKAFEAVTGWLGKKKEEKDEAPGGGGSLNNVLTGKKYEKMLAVDKKKGKNKDKGQSEQQTDRKKKTTSKSQERIVDPAIFYANTVDFDYDFWEFSNRCIANPFYIRFEHSEILYNNLTNNNNTSSIQNIQNRFSQFKQVVKVGEWQGNVDLFYDINNTLTGACGAGTFFYDDLDKLFKPWRPKYKTLQSFTHGDTFNTATAIGEEDVDIIPGEKKSDQATSHDDITKHDNRVLFTSRPYLKNGAGKELLFDSVFPNTPDWIGSGWNYNGPWEKQFELPPDNYTYFWKIWTGPEQSGTHEAKSMAVLTIAMKEGGGLGKGAGVVEFKLESGSDDQYIYRYKFERIQAEREQDFITKEYIEPEWIDNNTQFTSNIGETDPEQLEKLAEFDKDPKETNFDKPETDIKEKSGEIEKDFEKQLEKIKELEKEKEIQRELEKEKEKQRELEREKELQKDRESQTEAERNKETREKQAEQERKTRERLERETKTRERQAKTKERLEREAKVREKEKKERE